MIQALNRTRGRRERDGGMFTPTGNLADLLDDPEARPIIERALANTCVESPIDRHEHALRVAAVVITARRRPFNPHAAPTLGASTTSHDPTAESLTSQAAGSQTKGA